MKRIISLTLSLLLMLSLFVSCSKEPETLPEFKNLVWAVGTEPPKGDDFAVFLPDGWSLKSETKLAKTDVESIQSVTLSYRYQKQKAHKIALTVTYVKDTEAPTIIGANDLSTVLGSGVAYMSGISTKDNCDNPVTVTVDSSHVNLTAVGSYQVTYTAEDAAGNKSYKTVPVYVYRQEITEEMLHTELDKVINQNHLSGKTAKEKCRFVYDYVYDHLTYSATSDKSDWVRAAYSGLINGDGDCFTYFALSKAFLNRLGVENVDVEREQSAVARAEQRHYWNLVNIGTKESPQWYHFDACHLSDMPKSETSWGFLMTDGQLADYSAHRIADNGAVNYFYSFDESLYPARATVVVTNVPKSYFN